MGTQKIVLIGAGSAMFTRGLVADLILTGKPWHVGLVDIDPAALETAEGLSRRMIEARGAEIALSASTERRDLLPGADVVVTTVGVGGAAPGRRMCSSRVSTASISRWAIPSCPAASRAPCAWSRPW